VTECIHFAQYEGNVAVCVCKTVTVSVS